MHLIDWIILLIPLLIVLVVGAYTHRYMKSVADFMSGGRLAGRYLLAVARGEMLAGAVVFVAAFEVFSQSGFVLTWWNNLSTPVGLLLAIFGFVIYRYRETRVMTLAQFFELRYSKSFRVFAGALGFGAGILNFGIIPAVGSRFLVYFLGLPATVTISGYVVPTYIPVMAGLLTFTVILTLSGGLLTVMVTDCVEGILSQVFYLIIIVALLCMFTWPEISSVLANRPAGHSLLNPFDSGQVSDFNFSYVLMVLCTGAYSTMAWQNSSAYNSAALSAHESRMGGMLGKWRELGKISVVTLLAISAMTFLTHPDFSSQAAHAKDLISQIDQPQIQRQMTIPIGVSEMLPVGIKGLLCAILIMGVFGGDSTHLHSWSGILVQDVLLPLRKKSLTPQQHIFTLRCTIIGVAVFAFLFGSLFRQTEYVSMWFQVTTGIFVGGAGSVIIGGLYWKKGTTAGAWSALIIGSITSLGGILARQFYGKEFPLNGTQIYFTSSLISISAYVIVSLLTCRENFNMDRMLHRGIYATEAKSTHAIKHSWTRWIGFDENFSLADKWIAGGLASWGMFWFAVMVIGTIWNLISPWPLSAWSSFWHFFGIVMPVFFTVLTGIWFTWGGVRDIRDLFRRLSQAKVNPLDNGVVVNHQNLDDATSTATSTNTKNTPAQSR